MTSYYFPKRRTVFAYCATSIQKQIWFPTALILGKLQLLAILNLLPLTLLLDSDGDVDSRVSLVNYHHRLKRDELKC